LRNFYNNIQENYSKLNELEKEILDFIKKELSSRDHLSLNEVSKQFFVSPNTVVRLAKKLGYTGFVQLREDIIHSIVPNPNNQSLSIDNQLVQTKKLLKNETIDEIITLLDTKKEILFYAHGLSKYPCDIAADKLRILGKNATVYNERHLMLHSAVHSNKDTLIFLVSMSGETKNLVECANVASVNGATMVSISGLSQNPIEKISDLSVFVDYQKQNFEGMDISSRFPISYFFEVLIAKYLDKLNNV
jgi:transcriptional regulator